MATSDLSSYFSFLHSNEEIPDSYLDAEGGTFPPSREEIEAFKLQNESPARPSIPADSFGLVIIQVKFG